VSYILDALKKSEKERQRGAVPDVLTSGGSVAVAPGKHRLLPYLILGALILNAGLFVWWLAWNPKKPQTALQAVASPKGQVKASEPAKETASGASAPLSLPEPAKNESPSVRTAGEGPALRTADAPEKQATIRPPVEPQQAGAQQKESAGAETKPSKAVPARKEDEPSRSAARQTGINSAFEPQPSVHDEMPIRNKLYSLQELPQSLRRNLPDFSISTHLYSADVTSRMARVNGQMLREGQFLSAGLKLEEITSDGLVFDFQGYRFRVGLK
jgi:general secretion pathway protein B